LELQVLVLDLIHRALGILPPTLLHVSLARTDHLYYFLLNGLSFDFL
jgi:hypothetical protein